MPFEPDRPGLCDSPQRKAAGMPVAADARHENKTMTGPQRPGRLDAGAFGADIGSFRLHLAAEGKAARTVQGYTVAVRWFAADYLLGQAGKTSWEQVDRQDIQQRMVQLLAPLQRCLRGAVGRATFLPGWRWSEHVKPIAKTDSCQAAHMGYFISGRMKVVMDDGEEMEFGPGDFAIMAPGHDAWTVGDEPCVVIDWQGFADYAKR